MSFKSPKIAGGHVRWTVLWANAVGSRGVSPSYHADAMADPTVRGVVLDVESNKTH
jgi:hypothetical protein